MYANSRAVVTAQHAPHARLADVVRRHLLHPHRRPHAPHALAAFEQVRAWLARAAGRPLWLDSGCGTGASTRELARAHPQVRVLGADRSAVRLRKAGLVAGDFHADSDALAFVRMPLEDLWRLLVAAGVRPQRQLLLYPNPWPKARQLRRRWHAHPAFPALLALAGEIELRSNWETYVREFALALDCCGWQAQVAPLGGDNAAISPFERKYRDSGHVCWRLLAVPPASAGGSA